ncbi:hypothetical protein ABBQ38_004656 [Trebouxia sp. C0009 RCD-2024]
MDGSKEAGAGARRTVRVLRGVFDKDARRSEGPPVVFPSSPSRTQPREVTLPTSAEGVGGASAPARMVATLPTSHHKADSRLGRRELTVLLEDRPATDTGVHYCVSDLVTMTKRDLVGVLGSMGQAVGKRQPTR